MATERLLPAFVDETHCEYKSVDSGHPLSTAFGCDENAETYKAPPEPLATTAQEAALQSERHERL